jgi:hypothetical protein
MSDLLDRLGTTKKNPRVNGSVLDLYNMVTKQMGLIRGGLTIKIRVYATIDGQLVRSGKPGDASIHLVSGFNFMVTTPEDKAATGGRSRRLQCAARACAFGGK